MTSFKHRWIWSEYALRKISVLDVIAHASNLYTWDMIGAEGSRGWGQPELHWDMSGLQTKQNNPCARDLTEWVGTDVWRPQVILTPHKEGKSEKREEEGSRPLSLNKGQRGGKLISREIRQRVWWGLRQERTVFTCEEQKVTKLTRIKRIFSTSIHFPPKELN